MKNHLIHAASAISLLAMASCAPELARSEYGQNEMLWKQYIQTTYKGWQPPPPPPPLAETPTIDVDQAPSAIEAPPPPAESPDISLSLPGGPALIGTDMKADAKKVESTVGGEDYIVQKGDTLSGIAKAHYKSASKWQKIYDANKDVISNPKTLKPGTKLRIPPAN